MVYSVVETRDSPKVEPRVRFSVDQMTGRLLLIIDLISWKCRFESGPRNRSGVV